MNLDAEALALVLAVAKREAAKEAAKITKGDKGDTGPAPSRAEVLSIATRWLEENAHRLRGKPGDPGKDARPITRQEIQSAVDSWLGPRINQLRGKDAPPISKSQIAEAVADYIEPRLEKLRGPKGDEGPVGPRPAHQIKGTKLRFEKPDGSWGEWIDLGSSDGPGASVGGGGLVTPQVFVDELPPVQYEALSFMTIPGESMYEIKLRRRV